MNWMEERLIPTSILLGITDEENASTGNQSRLILNSVTYVCIHVKNKRSIHHWLLSTKEYIPQIKKTNKKTGCIHRVWSKSLQAPTTSQIPISWGIWFYIMIFSINWRKSKLMNSGRYLLSVASFLSATHEEPVFKVIR